MVGDFIMLEDRLPGGRTMKMYMPFKGSYVVTRMEGPNAHCLPIDGSPIKTLHIFKLKLLKWGVGKQGPFCRRAWKMMCYKRAILRCPVPVFNGRG